MQQPSFIGMVYIIACWMKSDFFGDGRRNTMYKKLHTYFLSLSLSSSLIRLSFLFYFLFILKGRKSNDVKEKIEKVFFFAILTERTNSNFKLENFSVASKIASIKDTIRQSHTHFLFFLQRSKMVSELQFSLYRRTSKN